MMTADAVSVEHETDVPRRSEQTWNTGQENNTEQPWNYGRCRIRSTQEAAACIDGSGFYSDRMASNNE